MRAFACIQYSVAVSLSWYRFSSSVIASDSVVVGPNCCLNSARKSFHVPKSPAVSFASVKPFAQISASPPSIYERATVIFFSSVERMAVFPLMNSCSCRRNVSYSFLLPSYLEGVATRDF